MNKYICECGHISYSFDKIFDIPLTFPGNNITYTIKDMLKQYFNEQNIIWTQICPKCGKRNLKKKIIKFDIIKNKLFFSFQRIDRISKSNNKLIVKYDIINLNEYYDINISEINNKYHLIGLIYHLGTLENGHYKCDIKLDNQWFNFNDNYISKINNIDMNSDKVCVLVYKRFKY